MSQCKERCAIETEHSQEAASWGFTGLVLVPRLVQRYQSLFTCLADLLDLLDVIWPNESGNCDSRLLLDDA